jgi:hypothetical protein
VDAYEACGLVRVSYNSCRDRHCPKCQSTKQVEWLQTRLARLLPVEYFHVVFTLPAQLQPLALKNQRLIYDLLFQSASQTLLQLAADPKRLGAQLGLTAVLHTWGQNLLFHPHLHCVVTGGGLSLDGQRWVAAQQGYLFPVKVLARLFRGKFLAGLKTAHDQGRLNLTGSVAPLAEPRRFRQWLTKLYRQNWIVYAKPPLGGAEQVYRYLGRYTHRVAISNGRLVSLEAGRVRFRYKDYADASRIKEMTLSAEEFIRRFLLHVLPKQFVRIRHYGLLASRNVSMNLARCRQLLQLPAAIKEPEPEAGESPSSTNDQDEVPCCPHCHAPLRRLWLQPLASAPSSTLPYSSSVVQPVPMLDSS